MRFLLPEFRCVRLYECFVADWASAIIKGVKYYSDVDIHVTPDQLGFTLIVNWTSLQVNCFGKILRNELNEDFR